MDQNYAQYLLNKGIENYNLIADDFSRTRKHPWPGFEILTEGLNPGDRVLDLGCGNGRLLDLLQDLPAGRQDKNINYIGLDNSSALIALAQKRYPGMDFRKGDALNLPFSDNYFDKIYSIAVLHHIPSQELRLRFLLEAKRVLKPQGLLILTVWDLRARWPLRLKYGFLKIIGRSKLDFGDVFVPWQKKQRRYVHCFAKRELTDLAKKAGFAIKQSGTLKTNFFIVVQKS